MSRKSSSQSRFLKHFATFIFVLILLFIGIGVLTTSNAKYYLSFSNSHDWFDKVSTKTIIHAMGTENPYFTQDIPKDHSSSISSLILKLTTNIKVGDLRSLLGNELPGFQIFDTQIAVPGEGTDYTNMVVESAPPLNEMLRERKEAQKKLNQWHKSKEDNEKKKNPPSKTTHGKRVVYIYHTHSWESYLPILGVRGAKNANKATDAKTNVSSIVGKEMTRNLENQGIGTLHDTHNMGALLKQKGWNYPQAYKNSRQVINQALNHHKSLKMLIDIHRDSSRRKVTTTKIHKKSYARATFVIGGKNQHYKQNLQFAKALHKKTEKKLPGLSRGVLVKGADSGNGVYNQDLSPHAVLIEIGGVDNTLDELNRTVKALSEVIGSYYWHNLH